MSVKISALPAGGALTGAEYVPMVQTVSGTPTTVKVPVSSIMAGGLIPQFDFQRDFGADPTFTSDCSTAWANAMTALEAAGGGELFMGYNAHYKVSGALLDASRGNAQLLLPSRQLTVDKQIRIVIRGGVPPSAMPSVSDTIPQPDAGVIIESTLTTGAGAILGGWGPSGAPSDFTAIEVILENLEFRTIANPTITGVDLSHIGMASVNNVVIDTGEFSLPLVAQPTTTTSYGLRMPANNNGAFNYIGVVNIVGFYNGYEHTEHTYAEQPQLWACAQAIVVPFAYHASRIERALVVHCPRGIVATGDHYLQIGQFDIEHAPAGSGWLNVVYDLDDAANHLYGPLNWHVVLGGTGVDHTFLANGGANTEISEIGYAAATGGTVGQLNGVNEQTGTTYTLVLGDTGKDVRCGNASAVTLTVPPESSVAFPVGTWLLFSQGGAGAVTATGGAGVTVTAPNGAATTAAEDVRGLEKIASDSWRVI